MQEYTTDESDDSPEASASDDGWNPTSIANREAREAASHLLSNGTRTAPTMIREILPGGRKALDGIAMRAFSLGLSLGVSAVLTILLVYMQHPIWRAPFFVTALSLFHFLEYYTTAAYNTRFADLEAFLLTTNGRAYNAAHTAAFMETLLTALFARRWQAIWSTRWTIALGLGSIVVGQVVRSAAMIQAGTNFNHTVQRRRNSGHVLVKTGVYALLRHPSYFGFFWWGLGTQLVLGNVVCFSAYTVVLWLFFRARISSEFGVVSRNRACLLIRALLEEEEFLVRFFGKEYEDYRTCTPVGIPFIH